MQDTKYPNGVPRWLKDAAWNVQEWVAHAAVLHRFEIRVRAVESALRHSRELLGKWETECVKHCRSFIPTLDEVRAEFEANPASFPGERLPGPSYCRFLHGGELSLDVIWIGAETTRPIEYQFENRPVAATPRQKLDAIYAGASYYEVCGIDTRRLALAIEEKYWLLAEIHDVICVSQPPVLPTCQSEDHLVRAIEAHHFKRRTRWLLESANQIRHAVESALKEVEHDLQDIISGSSSRRPDEITLAEAAEKYDIAKPAWSKAANKKPEDPGYLPTRSVGRNRYVRFDHAKHFAENHDARRDAKERIKLKA